MFKTTGADKSFTYRGKTLSVEKQTQSLNLIGNNYKLQIINVDNQMSQLFNFTIKDLTGAPVEIPINEGNLSSIASLMQAEMESS